MSRLVLFVCLQFCSYVFSMHAPQVVSSNGSLVLSVPTGKDIEFLRDETDSASFFELRDTVVQAVTDVSDLQTATGALDTRVGTTENDLLNLEARVKAAETTYSNSDIDNKIHSATEPLATKTGVADAIATATEPLARTSTMTSTMTSSIQAAVAPLATTADVVDVKASLERTIANNMAAIEQTYLTAADAENTYLTKQTATSTLFTKVEAGALLTKLDAGTTYFTKAQVNSQIALSLSALEARVSNIEKALPGTAVNPVASCSQMAGYPSAEYFLKIGSTAKKVYCDMTSDGGGWALVVYIHPSNQDHSNIGQVGTPPVTPMTTVSTKFSDDDIRSLLAVSAAGSGASIRFFCDGHKHFVKNCAWRSTKGLQANDPCVVFYTDIAATSIQNNRYCNAGSGALGSHCSSSSPAAHSYCSHCARADSCCSTRTGCGHDNYGYGKPGTVWVR